MVRFVLWPSNWTSNCGIDSARATTERRWASSDTALPVTRCVRRLIEASTLENISDPHDIPTGDEAGHALRQPRGQPNIAAKLVAIFSPFGGDRYDVRCLVVLAVQWAMLSWIALWNSPVCDEVGHLTAGIFGVKYGQFHLYNVNPPLVRSVAALPAVWGTPTYDWKRVTNSPLARMEFPVGQDFIRANGVAGFWYFTLGRLLCVPFALIGGWFCYLWARRLAGGPSGVIAAAMWALCPAVLGWGSTFTPDAACASLGLAAQYAFWRWLREPSWPRTWVCGLALGLALLTKTVWVILFPLWCGLWLVWSWKATAAIADRPRFRQLAAMFGIAIYLVNLVYGYEGSLRPLGDFTFVSRTLAGTGAGLADGGTGGNRFAGTWLGQVPVPFPENYVRGVDVQKVDFERGMASYLFGQWSPRGWWYYYFVVGALKIPLGTWGLLLLSLSSRPSRQAPDGTTSQHGWRDWLVLWAPAVSVFVLLCAQSGFSRYLRYALPCLPAVYVSAACCFRRPFASWSRRESLACICLAWSAASSLSVYPHSLSYFNELAGGPVGGPRYLLDANVDWGQDLFRLKKWTQQHPDARPLFVAHMGFVSASDVGIDCVWPTRKPRSSEQAGADGDGLVSGFYALSNHELRNEQGEYDYFLNLPVHDRIGYSMSIYWITADDVATICQRWESAARTANDDRPRGL